MRGVGHGPVLVNGVMNSVMARVTRVVPHSMLNRLVATMMKPKEA